MWQSQTLINFDVFANHSHGPAAKKMRVEASAWTLINFEVRAMAFRQYFCVLGGPLQRNRPLCGFCVLSSEKMFPAPLAAVCFELAMQWRKSIERWLDFWLRAFVFPTNFIKKLQWKLLMSGINVDGWQQTFKRILCAINGFDHSTFWNQICNQLRWSNFVIKPQWLLSHAF